MNTFARKIETAFNDTKVVIEGICDMLKELSTPLAAVIWAAGAFIPVVWCLAMARTFGAF